jgi:membrane protein implicated in regulation of membrane protease activity
MNEYLPILWLIITVGLVVLEASTYQLVAIWFAIGGLFAMLAAVFGLCAFQGQLAIFTLVSLAALIATRPFIKKVLAVKKTPTNADRIIGQQAVVLQAISPLKKGRIHVSGLDWSAAADEEIPDGAVVEVLSIEGVTVKVKSINK